MKRMKRMKRGIAVLTLAVTLALATTGCSSGTAPVLTVAGKEVTLGETGASVFPLTEFDMEIPGGGVPVEEMPGKSWMSTFMSLRGDGGSYAYLYVYNPGRDSVWVTSATIYKLSFHMYSEEESYWAQDNVLINGIDFYGMDAEAVKEKMSEYKIASDDSTYLSYKDGKYSYRFTFDESGIVEEIEVEMSIDKSY